MSRKKPSLESSAVKLKTKIKTFKHYLQQDINILSNRDLQFLSVVSLGLKSRIKEIIKGGKHNLLVRDRAGNNAVHIAAKKNDIQLLKLVCELGIPPNLKKRDSNNMTPFLIAAKYGSLSSLEYLHKVSKIDPTGLDSQGRNALFYAVLGQNLDCVRYLIKEAKLNYKSCSRQTGDSLLHAACSKGSLKVIRFCLENLKLDPHKYNYKGQNSLRIAVEANSYMAVIFLHGKYQVNPFLADDQGISALSASAMDQKRFEIFLYFSEVLPPEGLMEGDPMVTRNLAFPPVTAWQASFQVQNRRVLNIIYDKTILKERIQFIWICEQEPFKRLGDFIKKIAMIIQFIILSCFVRELVILEIVVGFTKEGVYFREVELDL